jgi:hypothetical protein
MIVIFGINRSLTSVRMPILRVEPTATPPRNRSVSHVAPVRQHQIACMFKKSDANVSFFQRVHSDCFSKIPNPIIYVSDAMFSNLTFLRMNDSLCYKTSL